MLFYRDPTADAVGWVRTTTTATMMAMMASSNANVKFMPSEAGTRIVKKKEKNMALPWKNEEAA